MHQLFKDTKQKVQQLVEDNATTILTAGGVVGTVGTAVLAWRGGYKSCERIGELTGERVAEAEARLGKPVENSGDIEPLTKLEKTVAMAPYFLPPVLTGSATVASIIMANRMSAQKAAALAAAYGLAEKNLSEYKDKVQEKLTGPKATAIRDDIQQDRVTNNPPTKDVIVIGSGEVLCYDAWSGRYFRTSVESIRRAENAVHREIMQSNEASLRSFYDELDLLPVRMDTEMGWNINHPLGVEISTVLTPDEEPCLAIEFTELPIMDFRIRY